MIKIMRQSGLLLLLQSVALCTAFFDIPTILFPTERSSLMDCPVRYYKNFEIVKRPGLNRPAAVNGRLASLYEFSHMAAIGWTKKDEIGVDWKCGGSLITTNTVLTAGHCLSFDGMAPDIVRLGDNNLYSSHDDEFAQQFKIESIIRHPNYRSSAQYDDIALLLLNGDVVLHDTVAPACLWRDDTIEFKELDATGWGRTHVAQQSETLMQVKLRPFSNSQCSEYYEPTLRMKDGLRPTQLCAGDSKSDTCEGDSGGPLEVKLLGARHLTPFLVGITSLGKGCGSQVPAVYTRVSSYIDWIEQTLNHTVLTDPIDCMLQYKSFLDFSRYKKLKISDFVQVNEHLQHTEDDDNSKHVIQIGWSHADDDHYKTNNKFEGHDQDDELALSTASEVATWECGGVLISENYVLTSALCLSKRGRLPHLVRTWDLQFIKISTITNHPEFDTRFYHHDMALIRLARDVKVSAGGAGPACLWPESVLAFDPTDLKMDAFGPTKLFAKIYPHQNFDMNKSRVDIQVRIPMTVSEDCNGVNETTSINSHYQICMKNHVPIVPGACEVSRGGGVHQQLHLYNQRISFVHAIISYGDNCGFNTPIVATKVQPYLGWINSVVFGSAPSKLVFSSYVDWLKEMLQPVAVLPQEPLMVHDGVVFFDDKVAGDVCQHGSTKIRGQCMEANKCNGGNRLTGQSDHLSICAVSPEVLVCCPDSFGVEKIGISIKDCAYKYTNLRVKQNLTLTLEKRNRATEDNELVHIGELYAVQNPMDSCLTTLISDQHVVTSAKCAANFQWKEMRLGWSEASQYFKITKVFVHPDYNDTANASNLVVMKLNTTVRFSQTVQPACIWPDNELIPYELQQPIFDNTHRIYAQYYAYNADCQQVYDHHKPTHKIQLNDTILCVKLNVCPKLGVALQKLIIVDSMQVPFVFGVYFQERNCAWTDDRLPFLYSRLAPYVDWIESVMDA